MRGGAMGKPVMAKSQQWLWVLLVIWLLKPGMANMWVCCWGLRYWDGQIYFCPSWWLARVSVSMAPSSCPKLAHPQSFMDDISVGGPQQPVMALQGVSPWGPQTWAGFQAMKLEVTKPRVQGLLFGVGKGKGKPEMAQDKPVMAQHKPLMAQHKPVMAQHKALACQSLQATTVTTNPPGKA